MTVKVRQYRRGGFEVDIRIVWPDNSQHRERRKSPVMGRSASTRWGQAREAELLRAGKLALVPPAPVKEVPTFKEFHPRFIEGHCKANAHKPSGIERKESVFRAHLLPRFGEKRLNDLSNEDVQIFKAELGEKRPKTVNNILTVLNKLLVVAVEWEVIDAMPCRIRLVKTGTDVPSWYEPEDYERLVTGAANVDARVHLMVLLGGDAGLRRGEIMALRSSDLDLARRQITVRRSAWSGIETETKGLRVRIVPMTTTLATALASYRHNQGPRILYADGGGELTNKIVRRWLEKAQRQAGLPVNGGIHRLRHTFCSALAASGAPAKAIQELAGHEQISTTLRYMHLSPASREKAIGLLDAVRETLHARGDILETVSNDPVTH